MKNSLRDHSRMSADEDSEISQTFIDKLFHKLKQIIFLFLDLIYKDVQALS